MSIQTRIFSEPPKNADGTYDKARIKQLYNDSPFIEWLEFCRSVNWNGRTIRQAIPFKGWKASKLKRLEKESAEEWESLNANHELPMRSKILRATRDYPIFFDQIKEALLFEQQLIRQDQYLASVKPDHVRKYGLQDLERVTRALKSCAAGHYSSLGVSEASLARAKEPLKALDKANEQKAVESGFTFDRGSGKSSSVEEIAKELAQWYDRPLDTKIIDVPKIVNPTFDADPNEADETFYDSSED